MRESYNRTCRFLAYAAAALTALLGFLVIVDLAAQTHLLFEIWPDFVPTFYNTGLLYFLFGIGIIYYLQGFKILPLIIFFLVPVIPTLVLIQYETGWNFGVDQLFYLMPMTEYTEAAGRISPITAAALLASCLAMLSQYFKLKRKTLIHFSSFLIGIPFSIALLSLLGYLTYFELAIILPGYTSVAPLTTIIIMLSSLSVIFLNESQVGRNEPQLMSGPVLAFVLLTLLNYQVIYFIVEIMIIEPENLSNQEALDISGRFAFILSAIIFQFAFVISTLLYLFQRRRVAAYQLSQSNNRLEAIVNSSTEAILTIDRNRKGRILFSNRQVSTILGVHAKDLTDRNLREIAPLAKMAQIQETPGNGKERFEGTKSYAKPDGELVHVEYCIQPIKKIMSGPKSLSSFTISPPAFSMKKS